MEVLIGKSLINGKNLGIALYVMRINEAPIKTSIYW
jgi:hypothetical protein